MAKEEPKPTEATERQEQSPKQEQPVKPVRKINVVGIFHIVSLIALVTGVTLFVAAISQPQDPRQQAAKSNPPAHDRKRERLKHPVPGRIVLKRKPNISAASAGDVAKRIYKAKVRRQLNQIRTEVIDVPVGEEDDAIAALKQDPNVDYVGRVAFVHSTFTPNDTAFDQQYGLQIIQAPTAWDITKGKGVKVGIIDTGIDLNHVDLQGKVAAEKSFISDVTRDTSVQDRNGHGTHVAGIISATTDNAKGVAGGCPGCKLIIAKALDGVEGSVAEGTSDNVAEAIIWATDQGAKVINTSLSVEENGNFTCEAYKELKDAIDYAFDKGVVVVAAAGNDGNASPHFPAAFDTVVSVANTDKNDQKYKASNYGADWVDVAAPGTDILSTVISQKAYDFMTGTSMASPHVAAIAALLFANGAKSNSDVIDRLQASSDNIKGTGDNWKYGRVNAANAVGGKDQDGKEPPPSDEQTEDPNAKQAGKRVKTVADPTQSCGDQPPSDEPKNPDNPNPSGPDTGQPGDHGKKNQGDDSLTATPDPNNPDFVCLSEPNCGQTGTPPPDGALTLTPGAPGTPGGPPTGGVPPDWLATLQQRLAEMRQRMQEAADEFRQRMEQFRIDLQNRLNGVRPAPPSIPVPNQPDTNLP